MRNAYFTKNPSGFCEAEIKLALIPYLPKSGWVEGSQTEALNKFRTSERSENAGETFLVTRLSGPLPNRSTSSLTVLSSIGRSLSICRFLGIFYLRRPEPRIEATEILSSPPKSIWTFYRFLYVVLVPWV